MKSEWEAANVGTGLIERETMYCRNCCASLRVRRLADVLILHYAERATSAAALVDEATFRELDVAEINSVGALHEVLKRHPRLRYSEFHDDAEPGTIVDEVRNEDICRLTYADESLDLVLTADTLEHVPDYRLALQEIRRVLRVGGRHIFTVPALPSRPRTTTRVTLDERGGRVFHKPPQYHGRGSGPLALLTPVRSDFLAYHDFGMDLLSDLRAADFLSELHFYCHSDPDSDSAFVFCGEAA